MQNLTLTAGAALLLIFLAGCDGKRDKPNIELVQDMMVSPAIKTQDYDPDVDGGLAMRLPPEGTVPQNFDVYMYKYDPDGAGKNLKNPIEGQLEQGKKVYEIYCAVCHGLTGQGDGTVAKKLLLPPPSLVTQKVKDWPDGRIYHVITEGQGTMGSYANQLVTPQERWVLINYLRFLQRSAEKRE